MGLLDSDSMRLIYALTLSVVAFSASLYFVRQRIPRADWVAAGTDALLLTFTLQYLAVGVPGLLRVLSATSIAITGLLLSAVLAFFAWRSPRSEHADGIEPVDLRP